MKEMGRFTYFDAELTHDGGGTVDIQRRIALASAVFHKLAKVCYAIDISRKIKVTLFKTLVQSTLLYGCETWKLTKREEEDWIPSRTSASEKSAGIQ